MVTLILLGAEGVSELADATWIREATDEEIASFKTENELKEADYRRLCLDELGRPYFPMVLLADAPKTAQIQATRFARLLRFHL